MTEFDSALARLFGPVPRGPLHDLADALAASHKTPAPTGAGDQRKDPAVFDTYLPPPPPTEGDSYPPKDNIGKPLIVKVREAKHIATTKFKPEGGEAVVCDVVDLATGQKYRDVLWMGGAVVDGLKGYAGRNMIVVSFGWGTARNGNQYVKVDPGTPEMLAYAQQYVQQHGDPFPPELGVPAPAAQPAWQAGPSQPGAQPWTAQAPAPAVATAPVAAPAPVAQQAPPAWAQQAAAAPAAQQPPAQSAPAPWEAQQPAAQPVAQPAPGGAVPPWERQG